MSDCPCGSDNSFADCCEPYLKGIRSAPTAEAAMRARYSAYVKQDIDYLRDSLTSEQARDFSKEDTAKWARESDWQGLEIIRTELGEEQDETGEVEFAAKFKANGKDQVHYEIAQFEKQNGNWLYSGYREPEGKTVRRSEPKIGRNDPCPCGSGKKYKKCCGV